MARGASTLAPDDLSASFQPRPFVVGTAGHVDHGKSTLVKALTGIDPDRLAEEKARAMTIDLGFAWLTLPGGAAGQHRRRAGPRALHQEHAGRRRRHRRRAAGHRRRRRAHAADRRAPGDPRSARRSSAASSSSPKPTPSTATGSIWCARRCASASPSTTLAGAPIVPVSALDRRRAARRCSRRSKRCLTALPATAAVSAPRLPVDRVFSVAGFGTVVTGTLSGGDTAPSATNCGSTRTSAEPACGGCKATRRRSPRPCRAAARPSTSPASQRKIARGRCAGAAGLMTPTQRLDVRLRLLPAPRSTLKQNDEVDFFTGASRGARAHHPARSRAVGTGRTAWVQLRFRARRGPQERPVHRAPRLRPARRSAAARSSTRTRAATRGSDRKRSRRWRHSPPARRTRSSCSACEQRPDRSHGSCGQAFPASTSERSTRRSRSSFAEGDASSVLGQARRLPATTSSSRHSRHWQSCPTHHRRCFGHFTGAATSTRNAREEARSRLGIDAVLALFDDLIVTRRATGWSSTMARRFALAGLPRFAGPSAASCGRSRSLAALQRPPIHVHLDPTSSASMPRSLAALEHLGEDREDRRRRLLRSRRLGRAR